MSTRLQPFAADILREVMNIGGAHAMTSLAKLSHEQVMITVPKVALLPLEHVMDFVGGSQEVMSMTIHPMTGDVSGFILFSYNEKDAASLISQIKTRHGAREKGETSLAILQEIGNILSGSCLRAIHQFLGVGSLQTMPESAVDLSGAVLGSILAEIGQRADDALIISLKFWEGQRRVGGNIYLLFDPDSTQIVLSAAKKKVSHSSSSSSHPQWRPSL